MRAKYAERTTVPIGRSLEEIKAILRKHGASEVATFEGDKRNGVAFRIGDYFYRFETRADPKAPQERDERRRWRVLALLVKAKITAIAEGASTFEREFMADIVVGERGETLAERVLPELKAARLEGRAPRQLLLEAHPS